MEYLPPSGSSQKELLPSSSSPTQVNDHIYELYKPTEEPSMDILFFHGLQFEDSTNAYLSTWTRGDSSGQIWPSTWLVEEFPKAHVFSVSYDACMMTTQDQGSPDLDSVAENLIQTICWADIGQALGRPVVLVGHSFGGLVIKSLFVKANHSQSRGPSKSERTQKIERFLQNTGGFFFYGTPHRGSSPFDKLASFLRGPLLPYVKLLSTESARLESEFTSVCEKYGIWRIANVGESLPTSWGLFQNELLVPEASARYGPDFCTAAADHITLCQPTSKTSTSFQRLKTFLQSIQPKVEAHQVEPLEARFGNMQLIPKQLVGPDLAVRTVLEMLQANEKVGLHGMGGVGKTTLAMVVFNKLAPTFEYSCFVRDMKLISGSVEDVKLKIWDRLHCHGKKVVDSYGEERWLRLRGKRLLLVLDDISENSDRDFDILSHIADDIGLSESRFIVTSRDGVQLNKMDEIYKVPFLDATNAKQLFMSCAFPEMLAAPIALESNVKAIVEKCGGLPLTLTLIGNYLRRKPHVKIWTQTLKDLDKANAISDEDQRLWAQLRLSYENLRENEQQMFLDVTAFFASTTWTLREAKVVWKEIYGSKDRRWQTLLDMSLVYDVKEDEVIRVHDQLRSLGRKIASESKKCRMWNHTEALESLQSTDELDDLVSLLALDQISLLSRKDLNRFITSLQFHALRLESSACELIKISRSALCRLKTVRCLDFSHHPIRIIDRAQENETFPTPHLVLLGCKDEEFEYLFSNLGLSRLLVLRLSGPLTLETLPISRSKVPGSIGKLSALKIFTMSDCFWLHSLPDEIGLLSHLECLRLLQCQYLRELPESFGALLKLKDLELIGCTELETLPESFGQLRALKYLKLQGSSCMHTLPDSFGHLKELQHLEFIHCAQLHILPDSFGHLTTLQHLEFVNCPELQVLPESFGRLSALESLEFHSCAKLNDLPEFLGQSGKLQHLVIDDCPKMKKLPNSLVDLKDLRCLSIQYIGLRSIPDFIKTLLSLETLELGFLPWLKRFPAWLGDITPVSPAMPVRRIFHVQDGRFALAEEQNVATVGNWIHALLVKDEVKDDDDAKAALESWGDLRENLQDLFSAGSNEWIRILWKNGKLKRLTGNLDASLKDLDAAVETCIDMQGRTESVSDKEHLEYLCRLERVYVRSALKDMDGAQEDAKVAFEYQSSITDLLSFERVLLDWCEIIGQWEIPIQAVYQPKLSFFDWTFLGMRDYRRNVQLLKSSYSQALGKVARSDFKGALEDLRVDAVDVRFLGSRAHALILQERGILKRLTGNFSEALDDLNSALKLISDRQFKGGDSRFTSGYESLKQRGFAKYLAGDLDGARDDATTAVRKFNAAPPNFRYPGREKHRGLLVRSLPFLEWDVDPEGWEAASDKTQLQVHERWEVAEDEVQVVEGGFFGRKGHHRRLGEQSLKFLGFNLIF